MNILKIEQIVITTLVEHCKSNSLDVEINKFTALIGSNRVLDSLGLVSFLVDVETAFLDNNFEISLTSEAAMSSRISPFRTINSLSNFIDKQMKLPAAEQRGILKQC